MAIAVLILSGDPVKSGSRSRSKSNTFPSQEITESKIANACLRPGGGTPQTNAIVFCNMLSADDLYNRNNILRGIP